MCVCGGGVHVDFCFLGLYPASQAADLTYPITISSAIPSRQAYMTSHPISR